tara:strand:+ start:1673 stop:2074 length:402 start_codon:yes stop_codon:yes gene_type:complete
MHSLQRVRRTSRLKRKNIVVKPEISITESVKSAIIPKILFRDMSSSESRRAKTKIDSLKNRYNKFDIVEESKKEKIVSKPKVTYIKSGKQGIKHVEEESGFKIITRKPEKIGLLERIKQWITSKLRRLKWFKK